MKKLLFITIMIVCAVISNAQTHVDFLGLPLRSTSKSTFIENLKEKGYNDIGTQDGHIMYSGKFLGLEATVFIEPNDTDDGVKTVRVCMDELNPMRMGTLYAELIQKYMQKYPDYKFTTQNSPLGGSQVMLRNVNSAGLIDLVSVESKFSGAKCQLEIFHAIDRKLEEVKAEKNDAKSNSVKTHKISIVFQGEVIDTIVYLHGDRTVLNMDEMLLSKIASHNLTTSKKSNNEFSSVNKSSESAIITRCAATTKKGTRCKRNAKAGSKYCWQHAR